MYRLEADKEWHQARRKAFWTNVTSTLRQTPKELLSFEEIAERLQLKNSVYRGIVNVPLQEIVGSVGRYRDFTRTFFPTDRIDEERWKGVAMAYLSPVGSGVPPIELYKIGDSYFVRDGNHRVSVARQLKLTDIEAHVWEYAITPDASHSDIDALLLQADRQDFLQCTQLDELRPDHHIRLTVPGGYTEMLYQITLYQEALNRIDETETPYPEAVTAWYDMFYETIVQKIRTEGVLELFPEHTEADFYVWIIRQHRQMKAEQQQPVQVSQSIRRFRERNTPGPWRNLRQLVRRITGRHPDEPF